MEIKQAVVPWSELKLDIALVCLTIAVLTVSLVIDLLRGEHEYFQRGGAVVVLFSAILAYRGLNKYWIKAENSFVRGYWLRVSQNQKRIDFTALILSIIGTAIWGYGDLIYRCVFSGT